MQLITIPVSKFSRKIILCEYGPEPIRVRPNNPLSDPLRTQRTSTYFEAESMEVRLDASIEIVVGKSFAAMLVDPRCNASLALQRAHLAQMLNFVWALSKAGVSAANALRQFYDLYDLDEDDYAFDSAYRLFVRFKSNRANNHVKKYGNIFPPSVLPNSRIFAGFGAVQMPPDETRLGAVCAEIEAQLLELRRAKKCRPLAVPKTLLRQVRVFVFSTFGQRPYQILVKKFGVSKSQIYSDIQRVADFLQYDPEFSAAMRPAVLNQPHPANPHSSNETTAARQIAAYPSRNTKFPSNTTPKNGAANRAAARFQ